MSSLVSSVSGGSETVHFHPTHTHRGNPVAKKKRTALPRVTVLAYSRRDLAAFCEPVERLRLYVDELRVLLETKKVKRVAPKLPPVDPGELVRVP
jgi:hypothetical protein